MKTSRRSLSNTLVIGVVAVLGVSACTSDPSAKRVAQDLVNTVAADQPTVKKCMLDVIDKYDDQYGLEKLGENAQNGNAEISGPAQADLDKFQAALADCR